MISATVVDACNGAGGFVYVGFSFLYRFRQMTAIEHIEVVASVLSAMDGEGPDFARCCDQQSTALCKMLGKYKKISVHEKLSLIVAVRGLRMTGVAKNLLFERVNGIYAIGAANASRKRPLQDYHSWPNFGTRRFGRMSWITHPLRQNIFSSILTALASSAPRRQLVLASLLISLLLRWV